MTKTICCLILFATFFSVGCSDKVGVSGKVTFSDGSPLDVGIVVFETDKFSASGRLQKDGTYTMSSHKENDGVPKGTYRVCITGATKPSGEVKFKSSVPTVGGDRDENLQSLALYVPVIDTKYSRSETSGITCNVQKKMTFDFTVEPPSE